MTCKHCNSKINLIAHFIYKGFCSQECQIAFDDLKENQKCEKVDFENYKFPDVSMGGLKKSKRNLQEEDQDNDSDFIGEKSEQDISNSDNNYYAEEEYFYYFNEKAI